MFKLSFLLLLSISNSREKIAAAAMREIGIEATSRPSTSLDVLIAIFSKSEGHYTAHRLEQSLACLIIHFSSYCMSSLGIIVELKVGCLQSISPFLQIPETTMHNS